MDGLGPLECVLGHWANMFPSMKSLLKLQSLVHFKPIISNQKSNFTLLDIYTNLEMKDYNCAIEIEITTALVQAN